jgi:hypothetical protein
MYCEQIHVTYDTESDCPALSAIMEFWTKITPGILQLLLQTKVVSFFITSLLFIFIFVLILNRSILYI